MLWDLREITQAQDRIVLQECVDVFIVIGLCINGVEHHFGDLLRRVVQQVKIRLRESVVREQVLASTH